MICFLSLLGFVAGGIIIGAIFGFAAAVSFNPLASQLFVLCGGVAGGIGGFVLGKFFLFLIRLVFRILFGAALGWVLGWGLSLIWPGAPSTLPLWFAVTGAIYFFIRHHHAKSTRNSGSSASSMDFGSTLTTGSGTMCRVRQFIFYPAYVKPGA